MKCDCMSLVIHKNLFAEICFANIEIRETFGVFEFDKCFRTYFWSISGNFMFRGWLKLVKPQKRGNSFQGLDQRIFGPLFFLIMTQKRRTPHITFREVLDPKICYERFLLGHVFEKLIFRFFRSHTKFAECMNVIFPFFGKAIIFFFALLPYWPNFIIFHSTNLNDFDLLAHAGKIFSSNIHFRQYGNTFIFRNSVAIAKNTYFTYVHEKWSRGE